jgi:hypothetical protein
MKRFGLVALLMVVNLYGCVTPVAAPPKYKIVVSKEKKTLRPHEWCSLKFALTNTRSFPAYPWIEAQVLDAENNTVDWRFVTFAGTIPKETNQHDIIIYTTCNRIRQVVITGNGQIVEPNMFAWKE